MKRWQVIAEVVGFLLVLVFVGKRFSQVRVSWLYLSDDLKSDLVSLGLGCIVIAFISVAILWGGDMLWKKIWRRQPSDVLTEPQYPFVGRWRHVAELVLLSVIFGPMVDFSSGMRGPGGFVVHWVRYLEYRLGIEPMSGLVLPLIFAVDTAVCFAILWGGYLLWIRSRQERSR